MTTKCCALHRCVELRLVCIFSRMLVSEFIVQGPVVQKQISNNPGLNI